MLLTEQELLERIDDMVKVSRGFAQQKLTNKSRLRLQKSMERMFKAQQKLVLRYFAKLEDMFEETIKPSDLDSIYMLAEDRTRDAAGKAMDKAAQDGLLKGSKALISELNVSMAFDLSNPAAVEYLERFGAKKVTQVNDSTRKYINGVVKQSADEGWSYSRTAKAIGERYSDMWIGKPQQHIASRAHFIAVTEAGNAYMEGQLAVGHDLMAAGLPMEKYWSTMRDDRVSDGCIENEGKGWIDLAIAFPSGHMRPLRFPGCRCDLLQRVSEKAKVQPPGTLEGYKSQYGINPSWTDVQRRQFIDQNANVAIRGANRRKVKELTEGQLRAQQHAVNNLARQPDEVVTSFLKRGEIVLAENDAAFAKMYGFGTSSAEEMANVLGYFDNFTGTKKRLVMRAEGKWSIGTARGAATFDHEMGHYIHYWSKTEAKKFFDLYKTDRLFDKFTRYSYTHEFEGFAESYTAWMSAVGRSLEKELTWKFQVYKNMRDERVRDVFKIIEQAVLKVRK